MHHKLLAAGLLAVSMTAFAADTNPAGPDLNGQPLEFDARKLGNLPVAGERLATLGPAPALSYVEVYAVGSSNVGWEYPPDYQFSTSYDHGGDVLLVVVLELGYGTPPIAKLNGTQLPSSANYLNDSVCEDAYGYLVTPCSAGQTIVGWLRYYDLSGNQSGQFYYQSTSLNSPWNTETDTISIL